MEDGGKIDDDKRELLSDVCRKSLCNIVKFSSRDAVETRPRDGIRSPSETSSSHRPIATRACAGVAI